MVDFSSDGSRIALVLSGGGIRGAYEVGVIAGIVEALGHSPDAPCPFDIFAGTSIGAINATYLAAHGHRADMNVQGLRALWESMHLRDTLRIRPLGLLPPSWRFWMSREKAHYERSLLDPRPFTRIVGDGIPWDLLHQNIDSGRVTSLFVPALDATTGHTMVFTELSPDAHFVPSKNPWRQSEITRIGLPHVMASSAIPLIFPAMQINGRHFFDGGLRFNTPVAPAIRCGADKLVVVSLLFAEDPDEDVGSADPSLSFLLGKLLNALLLDPITYDLQVLERLNRLMGLLENTLDPDAMVAMRELLIESRGLPYRRLDTLLFAPSKDMGAMAGDYLRDRLHSWDLDFLPRWLLRRLAHRGDRDADWAAYILFDGDFVNQLIELGYQDSIARVEEIRAFFEAPAGECPTSIHAPLH